MAALQSTYQHHAVPLLPSHFYSVALSLFSNLPVPHTVMISLPLQSLSPRLVLPSEQSIGADYNDKRSGERHQLAMWEVDLWKKKETGDSRTIACFPFSIKLKYPIIKLGPGSGESPWHAEDIDRPATDLCFVSQSKHVTTLFALAGGRRCGAPSM